MNIPTIIKYLAYKNGITHVDFSSDVIVRKTCEGTYIAEWNLPFAQPTLEELQALDQSTQEWLDSQKYIELRKSEYPAIQDQLDMLYWDQVNGTTNWKDAIQAIKGKYPKP